MPVAQKSYDISPGTDLADNAGFVPLSVLIDNYSPYWLLLPDAGRYVPPYTSGTVLPLIHADSNRAKWSNPPLSGLSLPSGYIDTAGFAHLTYVAEQLAYVSGSAVPNSVLSQQQSFSVAEGGTISETLPFLASGVRIDNPGGTAYTIVGTNLVIPPWTTAWLANFTTPFNTITIQPIANPNGTPNTTTGGPLVATFYAQQVTSSGGTPYVSPSANIIIVQSATANLGSIVFPQTATAGNLLVIAATSNSTINTPAGWTAMPANNNSSIVKIAGFYKISDGTETSVSVNTNNSAFVEISGLPKNGLFNNSSSTSSSGITITAVSVSSPYTPWLFFWIYGNYTSATYTVPAAFTIIKSVGDSLVFAYQIIGPTGLQSSGTGTQGSSASFAVEGASFS